MVSIIVNSSSLRSPRYCRQGKARTEASTDELPLDPAFVEVLKEWKVWPSQKKALSAFLIRSYSVRCSPLRCLHCFRCLQRRPLAPERYRSSRPRANEIGTSTERVDEGAIGPTGSGIGSRTLALHPWRPYWEQSLFSSVCVAAELPPLASVTCHRRRPADPALWVAAAITECPQ